MMQEEIIFAQDFTALESADMSRYCTHALCQAGEMRFNMAGHPFRMRKGDCAVFVHNELISDMRPSPDFRAKVVHISYSFIYGHFPRNDYDVTGKLTLLRNPVMPLTDREQQLFLRDFSLIRERLADATHRFHKELMGCYVEAFILDLYDFHARIYGSSPVSKRGSELMNCFIDLLRDGGCRTRRGVSYYASQLCITPKYLTEVSKRVSGFSANFWIERFTIIEITRQLSDRHLTLKEVSDRMQFSSLSYFCRYVERVLGLSPSEYRNHRGMQTSSRE